MHREVRGGTVWIRRCGKHVLESQQSENSPFLLKKYSFKFLNSLLPSDPWCVIRNAMYVIRRCFDNFYLYSDLYNFLKCTISESLNTKPWSTNSLCVSPVDTLIGIISFTYSFFRFSLPTELGFTDLIEMKYIFVKYVNNSEWYIIHLNNVSNWMLHKKRCLFKDQLSNFELGN